MSLIKKLAHKTINCSCDAHCVWARRVALPLTEAYFNMLHEVLEMPRYSKRYWPQLADLCVEAQVRMHQAVHNAVNGVPLRDTAEEVVQAYLDYIGRGVEMSVNDLARA